MRIELTVRGVVQGVGFRPFVLRKARALRLVGWVQNRPSSVAIEAQGGSAEIERFVDALRSELGAPCRIQSLERRTIPERADSGFIVVSSEAAGGAVEPALPPDLVTCADCVRELFEPTDRRHRYAFTNCTRCGPRYSIVEALPYDRQRTVMARFPLCAACRAEYADPGDRRFHAEPIACAACGPTLEFLDAGGARAGEGPALEEAATAVRRGEILALRGLGGFQLLVDATNAGAVERLRRRKHRDEKPFAVMFPNLELLRVHASPSAAESAALCGPAGPILLVRRRPDSKLADAVAPGNPRVGALLPTTPLHHLLLAAVGRPVVATSGNRSGEPMCVDLGQARDRLGVIADWFLTHDRPIARPLDDSVARCGATGLELLRRARGFTPLPVASVSTRRTILALGAHLKSTVALAHCGEVVLSQHLGDLDTLEARALLEQSAADLCKFFQASPELIACDLHPDYGSTVFAERLAAELGVPLLRVQHHHAHIAACMLEHAIERPVLGLAWDGTGLGTDGTSWGGEALIVDGARCERFGHLLPFRLPGGDRAAREPRRSALGALAATLEGEEYQYARRWFSDTEWSPLCSMLERGAASPLTSSIGRLFDTVAAVSGLRQRCSFEGQAAIELEFAAERWGAAAEPYPLPLSAEGIGVADFRPLVRAALNDARARVSVECIAARFHAALVELGVAWAERAGLPDVVLAGGCFQNALLSGRLRRRLAAAGFLVHTPALIPTNDGGIAAGQLAVAAASQGEA